MLGGEGKELKGRVLEEISVGSSGTSGESLTLSATYI